MPVRRTMEVDMGSAFLNCRGPCDCWFGSGRAGRCYAVLGLLSMVEWLRLGARTEERRVPDVIEV